MYVHRLKTLFGSAIALAAVLAIGATSFAQGTANGPHTSHTVNPGPPLEVFIGTAANPQPIDLDPNGLPWTKDIFGIPGLTVLPGDILLVHEFIQNVGTEEWTDWHEHVLPDPNGVVPGIWLNVPQVQINGNPALVGLQGLGTPNVWIDPIIPSVKPGDVLEIWKEFQFGAIVNSDPTQPLLTIEQYPTPEPASLALLGIGGLLMLARRRSTA